MDIWTSFGNFTLVALIVMVYSFPLYKENIFYRFVEYLFIGVTIGHSTVVAFQYLQNNVWAPLLAGNYSLILLLLLSSLLFSRFFRKYAYLARWPISVLIGSMMGLRIFASTNRARRNMLASIMNPFTQIGWEAQIGSICLIVGYAVVVLYFTWGWEHKGPLRTTDKLARYFLMCWFGVSFGSIAMARFTWLSGTVKAFLTALGIIAI